MVKQPTSYIKRLLQQQLQQEMMVTEGHVRLAAAPILGRSSTSAPTRDFVSLFGVSPRVCAVIFNIISFPDDIHLVHLLWALSFLKSYATEAVLISMTGGAVSRNTYRRKVWQVLDCLSSKTSDVVCYVMVMWLRL
jgi:hypothetical protein